MKIRLTAMVCVVCILLSGCGNWMDGSYVSVKPHREQHTSSGSVSVSAANYTELVQALADLVESGTQSSLISVEQYRQTELEQHMADAVDYVQRKNPIADYAVEQIQWEYGTNGGKQAVSVNITYNHNHGEIHRMRRVNGMDAVKTVISQSMDGCDAAVVVYVSNYEDQDFTQLVQDYADEFPEIVMEMPQVSVNTYPAEGNTRVLEIRYSYQTSRATLRTMRSSIQPIFDSAELYVSGNAAEHEKFSQLYSFLMERYDYDITGSITPAYSLLRYGVGDSKAFAVVYAAMCRRAGLQCSVISGTRNGEARFWNMIVQDGIAYHVDLLRCSKDGGFAIRTDGEMTEYVWDYSAYPGQHSNEPIQ